MTYRPELERGYVEPRSTDLLNATIQEHIEKCDQCRRAIDSKQPAKFGMKTKMCREYLALHEMWMQAKMLDSTT